jgi:hypothetical protein
MDDVRESARLRVNMRKGRAPADRTPMPRVPYVVIILVAVLLLAIRLGLGHVSPAAGVAFGLGLRWLLALGYVTGLVLVWRRVREGSEIPLRWMVFFVGVAAWFLVRAVLETYSALT